MAKSNSVINLNKNSNLKATQSLILASVTNVNAAVT